MATFPEVPKSAYGAYIDDSEYENVDGHLRRRFMGGAKHSDVQFYLVGALRKITTLKVRQEWSILEGKGRWLTPDVTVADAEYRLTRSGHLWVPPAPRLVVEVRSEGQDLQELFDKANNYSPYKVPYYWVIDPEDHICVEVNMQDFTRTMHEKILTAGEIQIEIGPMWALS
jgi:Uma2 family endonuclease